MIAAETPGRRPVRDGPMTRNGPSAVTRVGAESPLRGNRIHCLRFLRDEIGT